MDILKHHLIDENKKSEKKGEKKMITAGLAFLGGLAAWAGILAYDSLS